MNHSDFSLHHASSHGWHLLGELELTIDPDSDRTVAKWLAAILSPLHLDADLLNRVLKSAQDATARATQTETVMRFEHTHLLVFVPSVQASTVQTWSFFRIEKVETATENEDPPDHSIELYLYAEEGRSSPGEFAHP